MKKTVLGIALLSTIVLGSTVTMAADKTRNTKAVVTFGENTGTVNPVDPMDPGVDVIPEDPIDPSKPVEPGTSGPLSLDYASNFKFVNGIVTTKDQLLEAAPQIVDRDQDDRPLYAQVTDNRGTGGGWKLLLKQDKEFMAGNKKLEGAEIRLANGQIDTISTSLKPAMVVETLNLVPEAASVPVLEAGVGEGTGTYVYRFGSNLEQDKMKKSVTLFVPGSSEKQKDVQYETTLTWTLAELP